MPITSKLQGIDFLPNTRVTISLDLSSATYAANAFCAALTPNPCTTAPESFASCSRIGVRNVIQLWSCVELQRTRSTPAAFRSPLVRVLLRRVSFLLCNRKRVSRASAALEVSTSIMTHLWVCGLILTPANPPGICFQDALHALVAGAETVSMTEASLVESQTASGDSCPLCARARVPKHAKQLARPTLARHPNDRARANETRVWTDLTLTMHHRIGHI